MGRIHVDLALSCRLRAIVATDSIDERLERIRSLFGARAAKLGIALYAVNPSVFDVKGLVGELTDYRGAVDVIVAVGSRQAIENAQVLLGEVAF